MAVNVNFITMLNFPSHRDIYETLFLALRTQDVTEWEEKKKERITSVDIVCPFLFRRNLKETFYFLFFLQCSLNPKVKRTAKIDFTAKEKKKKTSIVKTKELHCIFSP